MRAITKGQVSRPIEQGTIDVGEFVTVEGGDLQFVSFPSTKSVVENTTAVDTITTNLSGATFSISGVDSSLFTIGSSSGVLAFASAPDFESPQDSGTNNVYNITVTATKNSETINSNMAITVVNEIDVAPVWGGHAQNFPVVENAPQNSVDQNGNVIQGEVVFTPQNYSNVDNVPVNWSFGAGTQTGTTSLFSIDATTGVITVDGALDYENTPLIDGSNAYPGYRAVVNLSWSGTGSILAGSIAHDVLIRVNNAFDIAPTWNSSTASTSVDEGVAVGTAVYNPSGAITNPDNGAVTFSIVSQTPANVFEYVAPNIQLAAGQSLDHETNTSHSVVIGMTYTLDGQSSATVNQTLTVNVNDLDDTAPVFTSPSGIQAIVENDTATAGNTICTISMADPDSASVVYSIQDDGGAGNRIQLANPQTSTNMTLLQTGAGAFDWENTQQAPWQGSSSIRGYEIVVRATDPAGNFTDLTIQLQVSNADDEPEQFPSPSIPFATVEENEAPGVNIGATVTTLANGDLYTSPNTFELLDSAGNVTDAGGRVTITSPAINTFQLKTGEHFFDYDTTTSHIVTVKCTDGGGNVSYQTYVIAVSDIQEVTALSTGTSAAIWYSMQHPILSPMLGASTYMTASDTKGGVGGATPTFSSNTTGVVAGEIVRNPSGYSSGAQAKRIYATVEERFNESGVDTAPLPAGNVAIYQDLSKGGDTQTHNHTQYKVSGVSGGVALSANTLNQSVEWTNPADGVDFEYGAQGDSSWSMRVPIATSLYYGLAENQQSSTVNNLFEMTDGKVTVPRIKKKAGANVQVNTPYTFITMAYPIRNTSSTESYAISSSIPNFPKAEVWNRVFVGTASNASDGTPAPSNNIGTVCERGRQSASSVTSTFEMSLPGGVSQGLKVAASGTDPEGVTIPTSQQRPTFSMRVGDTLGITLPSQIYGTYGTLAFKSARGGGNRNNLTPSDGWTFSAPTGGNNTQSFTPTTKGTYYYQCEDHHWLWGVIEVYDRDYDAIIMKTGTPVAVSRGETTMSDGAVGNVRAGATYPYSRNVYFIRNHYQETGNAADQRKISFFNTYADAVANTNVVPLVAVSGMGSTTQVFRLHPVITSRNDVTFTGDMLQSFKGPNTPWRRISTTATSYAGEYDTREFDLPNGDGSKKYRLYARHKATTSVSGQPAGGNAYANDWVIAGAEIVDSSNNVVHTYIVGTTSGGSNYLWQTVGNSSSTSSPTYFTDLTPKQTQQQYIGDWQTLNQAGSSTSADGTWHVHTGGTTSSRTGTVAGIFGSNAFAAVGNTSLITAPENGDTTATLATTPNANDDYKRQLAGVGYLYRETSATTHVDSYAYLRSQESFTLPASGGKLNVIAATVSDRTDFDGNEEIQFGLVEDLGLWYQWNGGGSGQYAYRDPAYFTGMSHISVDYHYSGVGTDPAGTNDGPVRVGTGAAQYNIRQVGYVYGTFFFDIETVSGTGTVPADLNWRIQATRDFKLSNQASGGYVDLSTATTTNTPTSNSRSFQWSSSSMSNSGIAGWSDFETTVVTGGGTTNDFDPIQFEIVDLS